MIWSHFNQSPLKIHTFFVRVRVIFEIVRVNEIIAACLAKLRLVISQYQFSSIQIIK